MRYQKISFKDNQEKANQILRYYGLDSPDHELPIDPELILRKMRIQPIPRKNLQKEHGIKGFVCIKNHSFQVFIDEFHYFEQEESSRFTLGEELGHIILHLEEVDEIKDLQDWMRVIVETSKHHRYIESQARTFASNIILPEGAFKPYVLAWVGRHLTSLKRMKNISHEDLAFNIASDITEDLPVSNYIVQIALNRWPDRIILSVIDHYPELMRRRLGE